MLKVAIIDADLIGRKRHRFPNLACMKLSGYWKELGADVQLELSYSNILNYDKVFISKVFTDTLIPEEVLALPNVEYGGTGFYFDKAPDLPYEVEHHFPDYHLYDDFVNAQIASGVRRSDFKEYLDYSIGYMTRGCFRKCEFCVNRKYDRVLQHSPLHEFYDPERPKICLLDDNVFGSPNWNKIIQDLKNTGKPFKFKQGLDERLLTDEKCEELCSAKYDGAITFAFDNIADARMIEKKLQMVRDHTQKQFTFYVLCGFDRGDKWDDLFWRQDIADTFERIFLLGKYGCIAYIMRFARYKDSPYKGMYITLARWCNQPSFLKKKTFRQYAEVANGVGGAAHRYMTEFENDHPEVAKKYFDRKWGE